ncbi:hypothetical protein PC9H_007154 [Pleurotus ostreatus]|uniref:Uncharacterized protein n=1 Tax=Pleurotus ostreatus TaxID=5322 RepID=A0A8H7DR93_PLEOS|nr:uncharacterized protein PC9H_007154 [Pleurotus ostreatus]KAF7427937.1 hypothetical protein PC9H_007154 [Pleurotus ostreatus]KAJ8695963.1 hypothetical protein PTI98_005868 [Pleurotus ostreatus]
MARDPLPSLYRKPKQADIKRDPKPHLKQPSYHLQELRIKMQFKSILAIAACVSVIFVMAAPVVELNNDVDATNVQEIDAQNRNGSGNRNSGNGGNGGVRGNGGNGGNIGGNRNNNRK